MGIKTLKRYQEEAVEELIKYSEKLIRKNREKQTIVFQAPTGSGKTFMMGSFIEQLINEMPNDDLCFLWISIGTGKLHKQSYNSLKNNYAGFPDIYLLEEEFFGSRQTIDKNEVVIVNWDKLNQKDKKTNEWKSTLMKDKEGTNFRELVKNTKQSGTKIILIIDESHTNSTSKRALEIRDEIIKADLTIEMSATPVLTEGEYQQKVKVEPLDVIEEGMIKKEIVINDHIDLTTDDETTTQELILQSALNKRISLLQAYQEANIKVNPLVLIQIPIGSEGGDKQEFIETFLAKNNITYENGKLAIWLTKDEEKINLEILENNTNKVEFLIFKQAIGTGWDCPRAQILVRFREVKSIVFNIQVVGRILRMPEAKHYKNDDLNKAYMYVNTKAFNIDSEVLKLNVVKSLKSKRKDIYKPLELKSYYRNRIDFGDITYSFNKVLEKTFCDEFGLEVGNYDVVGSNQEAVKSKINLDFKNAEDEIMLDVHIDTSLFDKMDEKTIKSDKTISGVYSENDIIYAVENLIKVNLNGYAFKRSISPVRNALYRWFDKYLGINKFDLNGVIRIYLIILNNHKVFSPLLDASVKAFKPTKDEEIKLKVAENEVWNEQWEIAEEKYFNPRYERYEYRLSLYEPCYLSFDSKVEEEFIDYIEKNSDNITWWWQNGSEHMAVNFGIKYGIQSTFQPDFLIMFNDGRLGIFDTKASGEREDDNKVKAEALQQYILEENQKGKNLIGGLVIKDAEHFRLNNKKEYISFKEKTEDWTYFKNL
ncbi:DEAD/DEAH box helicase family protein [Sulfurimonas sp.]|uniref:DEAD/DEAH box helicase n=1 Tax=Sulfurimonas sp. TaxID=2022749 RepID=UPI0019F860D9|nr:DEAD/DEAH box helicase family protein [Sulfurimonas sp.]MBE0515491.1 DEAD/DEAH box helicase family protein [Sulfurimonas sp.]